MDYRVHKWYILISRSSSIWSMTVTEQCCRKRPTITADEAMCIMKQFTDTRVMMVIFTEVVSYIMELGRLIMQPA